METILIAVSFASAVAGVVFGVVSWLRNREKSNKDNTKELVLLRADLDNLESDLIETKKELIQFKRDTAANAGEQRKELETKFTVLLEKINDVQLLLLNKLG
tara:strand:+ start:1295 stop:1600 length:306 start_codon:yes stop_codon:yes gene_type:complete